ncbi:MAG: NPCBM/NEW2 domain-containing protein [Verrucomicrobiota bacterium]
MKLTLYSLLAIMAVTSVPAEIVWLDELNLSNATQGWGKPQRNKSAGGKPLTIGGKPLMRGFGTHAEGILRVNLGGQAKSFSASVGVDDEVKNKPAASVEFFITGDGKELWHSGVMRAGDAAKDCTVDISGVKQLTLKAGDAGDGIDSDHADWGNAKFEMTMGKPAALSNQDPLPEIAPYILTPAAPATPRINGANIFGVRPGSPFLFKIPATGDRPIEFSAKNLPRGLELDPKTGIITGALKTKGEFIVTLVAKNSLGTAEKSFRIVAGEQIALTPAMGWNSWNLYGGRINQEIVLQNARAMADSGLINHGWSYINIDDTWQGERGGLFHGLQGNKKFPDLKALGDQIHALGLKFGIYSTPWVTSYANFPGGSSENPEGTWKKSEAKRIMNKKILPSAIAPYHFSTNDANQWAAWGVDYLKYDWNPIEAPETQEMADALRRSGRDIIFSLSNNLDPTNAPTVTPLANSWRTTGDISANWKSVRSIGFSQDKWQKYASPGHWNDPDMLEIGVKRKDQPGLTPDEEYAHMSLWCLLSAPLLLGCDMSKADNFTLSLLSNDEVLALDQDALSKQATCVINHGDVRIYEKDLEDGGRAIGFFNLGSVPMELRFNEFAKLGLTGKQHVRDLWRQKDLADVETANGVLPFTIPAHGVVLYKFTAAK